MNEVTETKEVREPKAIKEVNETNGISLINADIIPVTLARIQDKHINKMVSVRVMVSKMSSIKHEFYATKYACDCGRDVILEATATTARCAGCGGKMDAVKKISRDYKEAELEEILENIDRPLERMRCKIVGNMLDTKKIEYLQPGEIVNIIGTVKREQVKRKMETIQSEYYIIADKIDKDIQDDDLLEITQEEMEKIREIAKNNPIEALRDSLAPNVYGLEDVKTALLLQMVRGPKGLGNINDQIHILLAGEPGISKSVIAQESHEKTPRSIFGSGHNMTSAGLVSSTERDTDGKFSIRAGIICRAHNSMIVIDEGDKLRDEDKNGLLEPMEMGKVSTTKGGLHYVMPARTCVLMTCNPKNGSFDMSHYNSFQSQVQLSEPLMNRFHLIFILLDRIDEDKDRKIARALFYKKGGASGKVSKKIFQKYILYASKLDPTISKSVQSVIEDMYVDLRQKARKQFENEKDKKGKTNPRTLAGIIKLSVAAAKLRLSETVELQDVEVAEKVLLDALESQGFGRDFNSFEYAALYGGTTTKRIALIDKVKETLKTEIVKGNRDETAIKDTLYKSLQNPKQEIDKTWDMLRKEGYILGPARNISTSGLGVTE